MGVMRLDYIKNDHKRKQMRVAVIRENARKTIWYRHVTEV